MLQLCSCNRNVPVVLCLSRWMNMVGDILAGSYGWACCLNGWKDLLYEYKVEAGDMIIFVVHHGSDGASPFITTMCESDKEQLCVVVLLCVHAPPFISMMGATFAHYVMVYQMCKDMLSVCSLCYRASCHYLVDVHQLCVLKYFLMVYASVMIF